MSFHYRYRKQIIIIAIAVLMVATLITTTIYFYPQKKRTENFIFKNRKDNNQNKTRKYIRKRRDKIHGRHQRRSSSTRDV